MALLGYEKLDDIVGGTKFFIRFLVGYKKSEKNWWGAKNIQKIQKSPGTHQQTSAMLIILPMNSPGRGGQSIQESKSRVDEISS